MLRHGGFLFSYAISFATRDEFWQFYDEPAYRCFRTATGADGAFPDIYEKIGGGEKVAQFERGARDRRDG